MQTYVIHVYTIQLFYVLHMPISTSFIYPSPLPLLCLPSPSPLPALSLPSPSLSPSTPSFLSLPPFPSGRLSPLLTFSLALCTPNSLSNNRQIWRFDPSRFFFLRGGFALDAGKSTHFLT